MDINAKPVSLTPDSPILTPDSPILTSQALRIVMTLELITMTGALHYLKFSDDFDRGCNLPRPATLQELIALAFRRNHPVLEYIAEQNGITVTEYVERETFSQAMPRICYRIDDSEGRTVLRL